MMALAGLVLDTLMLLLSLLNTYWVVPEQPSGITIKISDWSFAQRLVVFVFLEIVLALAFCSAFAIATRLLSKSYALGAYVVLGMWSAWVTQANVRIFLLFDVPLTKAVYPGFLLGMCAALLFALWMINHRLGHNTSASVTAVWVQMLAFLALTISAIYS